MEEEEEERKGGFPWRGKGESEWRGFEDEIIKLTYGFSSDYDVFLSPLSDFKKEMEAAGLDGKVVYLDRKEEYRFKVREE